MKAIAIEIGKAVALAFLTALATKTAEALVEKAKRPKG